MHGRKVLGKRTGKFLSLLASGVLVLALLGIWTLTAYSQAETKDTAAQRGGKLFVQSCAFCHGPDATGARGPDLVRSALVAHDQKGELISEVIRSGRPDKGMPALQMTEEQIADIAAFLHARALEALRSAEVPKAYPAEKLLTGSASEGKAFFESAGGCTSCHSPTGDLAGVSSKYSAVELEARMLYPEGKKKTAVVKLATGEEIRGEVVHLDDFIIGLRGESGWYRSFSRGKVKLEVQDPLEAHQKLLDKLTQREMHNLYAYIYSLK